jgi:signal transduction histidine kinase
LSGLEAALREIAVLVARGASPQAVFDEISQQAARVCGVGAGAVVRFGETGLEMTGAIAPVARGALGLVRNTGAPARIEEPGRVSAAAPVLVEGAVWGALMVAGVELPPDAEERLSAFAELAALALASADARERLLESRARLVKTADETRKRLERDLHDGAQQRLVSAQLALRMLRRPELDPIIAELAQALEELRELARGLHPAALARGLPGAIGALAARAPLPVEYDVPDQRLPEEVEIAIYYVVSEAIQNAVKHAQATAVRVTLWIEDSVLVEVADDGRGGATLDGSGLVGLRDRVEALRGRLVVTSPIGAGTTLRAEFPRTAPR